MSIDRRQDWYCRGAGFLSGVLLALGNFWGVLAPVQLVGFLPVFFLAHREKVGLKGLLLLGLYAGFGFTLPQAAALRLPLPVTAVLIVDLSLAFTVMVGGACYFLRRGGLWTVLAAGVWIAAVDWANYKLVPMWGTAQSLARSWSAYPNLISFESVTGMVGVVFLV